MGLDFCAIDFETANFERGSPCAVGLVRVEDGVEVAAERWLMRPPEDVDWFDGFNVRLHGITEADVRDQPRFVDRLRDILVFGGGLPFVAHNAAFDMGVIRDACDESGLDEWPPINYLCTQVVARVTWPDLISYSLPFVIEAAGGRLDSHHDPLEDARAAAQILLAAADHHRAASIEDLADKAYVWIGFMQGTEWAGSWRDTAAMPLPEANADAVPGHPFYGRVVVITGKIPGTTNKRQPLTRVAELGGTPEKSVTQRTNILVQGYQDGRRLAPGAELSANAQLAAKYKAEGQDIEIMDWHDFTQLLRS